MLSITSSKVFLGAASLILVTQVRTLTDENRLLLPHWSIPIIGALSWFAFLGSVIAGLGTHIARIRSSRRRFVLIVTSAILVWWSAIVVAALCHRGFVPDPQTLLKGALFIPPWDVLPGLVLLALTLVTTAIGIGLYPLLVVRSPKISDSWFSRISPAALIIGSAVVAYGRPIFDLLARQHVERADIDVLTGAVINFDGPLITTLLWTIISASALGLVGVPFILAGVRRVSAGRWSVPSFRSLITSVVAGGFLVRLATLLTVAPTRTDGGDPLFYHVTANLLAQGRGFPEPLNYVAFENWIPSALHGPLYPLVLSFSSRLGGTTYFDHKFLSLLIGTAVVAMTALVAFRIAPKGKRVAAVIAGLLAAVYPNLWLVDGVLFPEGLMALLTTTVIYLAYRWWEKPSLAMALSLGVLIAASALTRGEGLLLSVLLVVPWFLSHRDLNFWRRLQHIMVTALACLIVLAPWTVRNSRSFEEPVPLSTNGNELFVYANCDDVYSGKFLGFWLYSCQEDLRSQGLDAVGDEAQKSLYWRDIGLTYARENAEDLPKVVAARIGRQWEVFRPWQNTEFAPIEGRNKDAARFGLAQYYAMIPLAFIGLRSMRRTKTRILPLMALFAMVTLTAAYAYGTTRFRVPAEPALCIAAAIGAVPLIERLRRRWRDDDAYQTSPMSPPAFVLGTTRNLPVRSWSQRILLSWLIVGGSVFLAVPALFRATGSTMEEGFMLVFPELVRTGAVANVDFLHLYGPGALYALAGWFEAFGTNLFSERLFGLLQHLGVIAGLTVLTRPWGRSASTAVGVIGTIFMLSPIGLQALAWPGALALGLWSVIAALRASLAEQRSPRWWIVSGLLAGIALTFRPDLIVALTLALGTILWKQRSRLSLFIGSFIVGLLPIWVHFFRAGLLAPIEGMFLDPVFRLRGGRELPRPPSWDRLDGALQVISEKFAPWWSVPHLGAPQQLFVWFFVLPVVALSIALVARKMDHHRPERLVLLAGALFGIGLLPQALQRPDSAHLLWVSSISWPLVIIAGIEITSLRRPRSHPKVRLLAGSGVIVILMLVVAPFYTLRTYGDLVVRSITGETPVREVRRGDRYFYLGDERPWRASLQVIEALHELSEPEQRLFVGPMDLRQTAYSDAYFYHLFPELIPATYFIEMDPGLANAENSRLADDVASADWLILTRFWSGWIEPNDSTVFGSDRPNQIVEEKFCLRATFQLDLVRLYERCAQGDGIGPYDEPYRPEFDYAVEVLVPVPPRPDGTCTPTCWGRPSESGIEIGIDTSVVEPIGDLSAKR